MKTRKLLLVFIAHFSIAASCLTYASYQQSAAGELYTTQPGEEKADYAGATALARKAEVGKAGAVFVALSCLLYLGVVLVPSPARLVFGNLLVLLYLLLFLEIGTRVVGVHFPAISRPGIDGVRGLWVYDETTGWFHAPLATAEAYGGGPDRGWVRINSLGLRGKELQPNLERLTRILVFGDSFVFGVGVDEENLLTSHLERLLQPFFPDGVEVVNMGVSGYSTDQEYLLLEEFGERLDPDVVILVVCDNDYIANSEDFAYRRYYKPYFDIDDDGELHRRNVPVPRLTRSQEIKLWLGQESNLWNFVRSRESTNSMVNVFVSWFQVEVPRSPRRPYKTTRAIVSLFANRVEGLGAELLVTSTGRQGENPDLFDNLSRQLRSERIQHLDLLPVLEEARRRHPDRHWQLPGDMHWDRDAHELAALTIADYLVNTGVISTQQP
jgi:hypothetical protein